MAQSPVIQRSTKGASKQRRDLINGEIERLKDLLPLSETIRQRLFQLQVMSLVCIYIRKERYLPHVLSHQYYPCMFLADEDFDICKTLRGFLLMVTRQGKLLFISENASDFLGHSVEEIMSQGDSLYDLVDPRDHGTVQAELLSGPPSISINMTFPDERIFMCRMNLNRAARRHLQYHKFIIVQGRYLHPAEYYQTLLTFTGPGGAIHPVFAAFCTPLITPENAENLSPGNTTVFSSLHNMDMKFIQLDEIGIYHLGYSSDDLTGTSWYRLIHPNDVPEASFKHKLLCEDKETCCVLLIRLQTFAGHYLWLHTVLALKEGVRNENVEQLIMATYQKLSDIEAATLQANCWIYSAPHRLQDQHFGVLSTRSTEMPYLVPCRNAIVASAPATPVGITPLISETLSATSPSLPAKPKRKYSKTKPKPSPANADKTLNSLQTVSCAEDYRRMATDPTNTNGNRRLGIQGLSPPTSDSPLADADQITVEIPFPHQMPPYFTLPSMLTPETSPANSTGSSCGGSHVSAGSNGGIYVIHQPHSHQSKPQMAYLRPSVIEPTQRLQIVKSPLPVIEPQALEAYLSRVESEGCLPVFRQAVTSDNPTQYDPEATAVGADQTTAVAPQSLRQLLAMPVGNGDTRNHQDPPYTSSTCIANEADSATDYSTYPPVVSGHWHRSFSWSPSSPFTDLTSPCENPLAAASLQNGGGSNGDMNQSTLAHSNQLFRSNLYHSTIGDPSHDVHCNPSSFGQSTDNDTANGQRQMRSTRSATSNSVMSNFTGGNRVLNQNSCRHGSLSK